MAYVTPQLTIVGQISGVVLGDSGGFKLYDSVRSVCPDTITTDPGTNNTDACHSLEGEW